MAVGFRVVVDLVEVVVACGLALPDDLALCVEPAYPSSWVTIIKLMTFDGSDALVLLTGPVVVAARWCRSAGRGSGCACRILQADSEL